MSGRFSPQRSLRSELPSLVVAAAVPTLLSFIFPREALRSLPVMPEPDAEPSCAFVSLTPEQEHKVLASARTAWQIDRGLTRRMNIDLFADSLPPMQFRPVLGVSAIPRIDRRSAVTYAPDPLPPTLAAPPPAKIAPQPDADKAVPTFSREELLKLN